LGQARGRLGGTNRAQSKPRRCGLTSIMLAMLPKPSGAILQVPVPLPQGNIAAVSNKLAGGRRYVVHTKPRGEVRAVVHFGRQDYTVFCPRCLRAVRHVRKTKRVLAPLFPSYVFLRLDVSCDQRRTVSGTRGVARLIVHCDTPQPMPYGIVEALQARMSADGATAWTPPFKIGQAVRIADGPIAEVLGAYLDARGRVRVLLDLLGRSVSVALRCDALMSAV
jgi:transcriptional antiterminator RfaH